MKFSSFADLINQVKGKSNRVVVPGANNKEALTAIKMADDASGAQASKFSGYLDGIDGLSGIFGK